MNIRNLALPSLVLTLSSLVVNAQLNTLAGKFDRSYGENGFAHIGQSIGQPMDSCCFHQLSDGRLVVVLSIFESQESSIWIARSQPNGALDTTFDDDGYVRLPNSDRFYAYTSELQPDGKIVIAGQVFRDQRRFDMFVTRVNPNGSLDTTFGNNGYFELDLSVGKQWSTEIIHSLRLLSDGKIIIGGISSLPSLVAPASQTNSIVARLNSDGTLDNSFGTNGVRSVFYGNSNFLSNVRISVQTDGKLLYGISNLVQLSSSPSDLAYSTRVMRFLPNGDLDSSFAKNGVAEISTENSFSFEKLVQLDDGKILCLSGLYRLTRLNSNGSFDDSFGNGGKLNVIDFSACDLSILPTGKILVSGYATAYEPPFGNKRVGVVTRFFPDGSRDIRFGHNSMTQIALSEHELAYGPIAFRNDGSFLVLGWKRNLNDSPQQGKPVLSRFFFGK